MTHETAPGIKVQITKREIERQLAALNDGSPVTPSDPQLGWTGNDMLALAGSCLFSALSQGPEAWGTDVRTFEKDVCGAVLAYSHLAALAADKEFEAKCGDHVLALAEITTEPPDVTIRVIRSGKLQ